VDRLSWGVDDANDIVKKHGQPDIVLAADCVSTDVYGRQSWNDLITTLTILASQNSDVYVCSTIRNEDGFEDFIALLRERFSKHQILQIEKGTDGIFEIHHFKK